jgi:predicted nucleic acid-binding protein
VLDASFWINAVRAGIVASLTDYFSLAVPPRVAAELTTLLGVPHPPAPSVIFQEWQQRGLIESVAPERMVEQFEAGENEAIALARERGWVLLIDNSAPRDWSRGPLGLRVVDSPAFAVFLYDQGRLDYQEVTAALARSQAARRIVREALILLAEVARRKRGTS